MRSFGNEETLLSACLRAEKGAWDEFIRRYSKLVYWSIRQTLGQSRFHSRQDWAGDIFQDVFQKLFERNDILRLDDAQNIRKFLVVLSANLTLDRVKSVSRLEDKSIFMDDGDSGIEAPSFFNPDEAAARNEKQEIITEVLRGLGARERACLEMDVFDGKKHREISAILGISQDNVSSIIRRAKDKIREKFVKKGI